MITELIKKDFSYTKRVNLLFIFMLFILVFFSIIVTFVNYKYLESTLHKENENYVHNISTFYLEQQIAPLERGIVELSGLFTPENVNQFVKGGNNQLHKMLMAALTVMPGVSNVIIAKRNGELNSVPTSHINNNFIVKSQPWFENTNGRSSRISYTDLYTSALDKSKTLTISKTLLASDGSQFGVIAMDLDLKIMSYPLRQIKKTTVNGRFFVVDRAGRALLDSDTDSITSTVMPAKIIKKMTSGLGMVYDHDAKIYYYYYSYSNPDWFSVFAVSNAEIDNFTLFSSKITLFALFVCILIYLLIWFYMQQSIRRMIVDIVSMMRFGRLEKDGNSEKKIMEELVENDNEMKKVRDISFTDSLTGILNRRSFDNDIKFLLSSNISFTLGIVDIDNFKSINDTYGHLVGDIVLKIVTQSVLPLLDEDTKIYRYGGEEIALINFSGDSGKSLQIMEQWRVLIEEKKWREDNLKVTFSAGLCNSDRDNYTSIIRRADKLLYEAKHSGKNKIIMRN